MIAGRVSPQLEATIPVTARGQDGAAATLRFVIDTGLDGSLYTNSGRLLFREELRSLRENPGRAHLIIESSGFAVDSISSL